LRNGLSSEVTALLSKPSGLGARGAFAMAGTADTVVRRVPVLAAVVDAVAVGVAAAVPFGVAAGLAAALLAGKSPALAVAEGFGARAPPALAVPVERGPACADDDPPDVDPPAEEADEDESGELPVESAAATP